MKHPNVIFILADDMGYGDFSAFNQEIRSTPALDSLIAEGVTLANCYASSPVCAPSRASIMTGRYPQRCGVIDTLEVRGYDRLKLDETTMADVFKHNGYRTALVGKWHLGAIDRAYHPNQRGFDHFFGFRGGWADYTDYRIERNGEKLVCDGTYLTDLFSAEAVRFIREHKKEPFFLHLAYNAPHFPMQAPDEVIQKYRSKGIYTEAVCVLRAMIEIMDRGIGSVLGALDECGLREDTIVIFMSDNGPDFGGEGQDCLRRFNCGLKGEKMLAYEGGIKVPAVVRYPRKISSALVSGQIVHGMDWLPTLMAMCGLDYPEIPAFDGTDIQKALLGEELPKRKLYWQWNRHQPEAGGNAAARDGDWKLVHAPVKEYLDLPSSEIDMDVEIKYHPERYRIMRQLPVPPRHELIVPVVELYDLGSDPTETNSLASLDSLRVQGMEKDFLSWFAEVEGDRAR